jgi:hypothetical protein
MSQNSSRWPIVAGAWRSDGGRTSTRKALGVFNVERGRQKVSKRSDLMERVSDGKVGS